MIHFSNNEDIIFGNCTGKIQPLLDMLQKKFQALYCPLENIVIDGTSALERHTNIQAVHPQQSPPLWNETVQALLYGRIYLVAKNLRRKIRNWREGNWVSP